MKNIFYSFLFLLLLACGTTTSQDRVAYSQAFRDYWYDGKAEITSYALQQARYGELHTGEAVLVFVTEPFSKSKQVKLDDWRMVTPV